MKSENTFSFAPLFRWVRRSAVVLLGTLLVLLLHAPLRAGAQGCPSLDTGDFTATLIAANSDCHTPARLTVTYRNAVAGFSAMAYSVSKNRTNYSTPVVTPRPGLPAVLPLDGWNEGEPIYIRAVATCGTRKLTVVLPKIVYHVKEAADVQATATITPAGGCEATGGAVSVHLSGVSGFSKAEFKLEKDGATPRHPSVPVGNLTARKPYEETLFFNLAPGRYTLRVRAVPDCVPATPGEGWKDGAYEWEQPVDVEHFGVTATTIPTRGNCPGGVVIGASKVVGIARLKYELWKKGGMRAGTPPLQTANVVYPAFAHTFTGLPLGDYEVRATATDCDATATGSFVITQGELVHPKVSIIRHTYAGCAAGRLQVQLDGTTAACPASYRLTPTAGGTPKVLTDVATETAEFSGLAAGTYTLTTTYGGQTINTPVEIKTVSPGVLKIKPTPAETYCSPTGAMEVTLVDGTLDESATLELSLDGNPVRSINLNAGETSKTIEGLLPGGYNVTLRTECGATASAIAAIAAKNVPKILDSDLHIRIEGFDFCAPTPMCDVTIGNYYSSYGATQDELRAIFSGASYEFRSEDNRLLSSGPVPVDEFPTDPYNSGINFSAKVPPTDGFISFIIRPACGSPILFQGSGFLMAENYNERGSQRPMVTTEIRPKACNSTHVKFYFQQGFQKRDVFLKVKKKDTGEVVGETTFIHEPYQDAELDLPNGEFIYEYWADCPGAPHYTGTLNINNKNIEPTFQSNDSELCRNRGSFSVSYKNYYEDYGNFLDEKKRFVLRDEAGTVLRDEIKDGSRYSADELPSGTYTVTITPIDPNSCLKTYTKTFEIAERDYEYPGSTPPGFPSPDFFLPPRDTEAYKDYYSYRAEAGGQPNDNTFKIDFYAPPGDYKFIFKDAKGTVIQTKTITNLDTGKPKSKFTAEFHHLPDYVQMDYPTKCGTRAIEKIYLTSLMPRTPESPIYKNALIVNVANAVPGCKGSKIVVKSNLLANGAPQKPTRLVVESITYTLPDAPPIYTEVESFSSTEIITEWQSKMLENRNYRVRYFYGDKTFEEPAHVRITSNLPVYADITATRPGKKGKVMVHLQTLSLDDIVQARLIDPYSGAVKAEKTMNGGKTDSLEVAPGNYKLEVEGANGCYMGQVYTQDIEIQEPSLPISISTNSMQCANDGVITLKIQKGYGTLDQVNYEITPENGGPTINGQTTTPEEPKEFPGLTKGRYTIKATGLVLHGFDGQPHNYTSTDYAYLSSNYETLVARSAPYASKPSYECGNSGGVGIYTEKGNLERLKVYLTETPTGPVHPRRELTRNPKPDTEYKYYKDRRSNLSSWGNDLPPGGPYKLFVTDGCTDIEIPNAQIPTFEEKAKCETHNCTDIDVESLNSDKLKFRVVLYFLPQPADQGDAVRLNYEMQIVKPGAAPDENNWSRDVSDYSTGSSWDWATRVTRNAYTYYPTTTRFKLADGYDVLYRLIDCPASMKRVAGWNKTLCNPFELSSRDSKCGEVRAKFTRYDTGRPYRIVVKRDRDNHIMYDQVKTFTYSPKFPPQMADELIFPGTDSYTVTVNSVDEQMDEGTFTISRHAGDHRAEPRVSAPTTCHKSRYSFLPFNECGNNEHIRVLDKATNTVLIDIPQLGQQSNVSNRDYLFERNKEYLIQFINDQGDVFRDSTWKAEYRLPDSYVYDNITLGGSCDTTATKTAGGNHELDKIFVTWESGNGEKAFEQIKKILVRNTATGRTYESHDYRGNSKETALRPSTNNYESYLSVVSWNEVRGPGDTLRNVTPSLDPGTYALEVHTACKVFPSQFTVTYHAPVELKFKVKDLKIECDGKITFTPTATVRFPDRPDPITIESYYIDSDRYNYINWGDPVETYKPKGEIFLNLSLPNGKSCTRVITYDVGYEPLAFDKSSTVSFFCSGADKGEINVGLKGGHPPYTYELRTLDGILVEKKTAPGVVTFEQGSLGSRYRIEATDDCGLTHIHQDVLLQDPAAIAGNVKSRVSYCEGAQGRLEAITFPGATYIWTRPDGSQSHDKVITFPATAANAGKYTVNIQLNSCNATINGEYRVQVAQLSESAGAHTDRTCAGQSTIFSPEKPKAMLDGEEVDEERLKFQWQYTKTPNDETSWKPIFGATDASVEYVAAYPGTYYLRRTTQLGECSAIGGVCTLTVDPGITVTMSAGERRVVIDHKNPFLLTAGIVSGPAARTYQWQRSLDGKQWSNIAGATEVTYTETQRLSSVVYYRRIVRSGTCETKGEPITVVFKRRYPAMINPQVRQRVDQHW